ncbi:unnamed protein product [Lactuca saligna]|uniref:Uncharacterized protein n=1 Tax=Lactuca saligna TaxID=75948 RepID=A0AA36ED32_LACSI|nr:unnamed protein product [Lactuca saligna]
MFEDDKTTVGAIPISTAFNLLQKPSSSKKHFDFGLSSSSEVFKEEENLEGNKHYSPPPNGTLKGDQGDKAQDTLGDDSKPTEPNNDDNEDDKKYESSTSDTRSSDVNFADPFSCWNSNTELPRPTPKSIKSIRK